MMKLFGVKSNWEFVVWYLIDPFVNEKTLSFMRTQIMRKDYKVVNDLLIILGHKKYPQQIEPTIQKTLQNMRDKGWISFKGQGEYALTDEGYTELKKQQENLSVVKTFTPEQLNTLKQLKTSTLSN